MTVWGISLLVGLIVGAFTATLYAAAYRQGRRHQRLEDAASWKELKSARLKLHGRERVYEDRLRSVVAQLDKYAEHIESNYMDADESSVIRSCSNMLKELVNDE